MKQSGPRLFDEGALELARTDGALEGARDGALDVGAFDEAAME
jgi:hypothetical protein